METAAAAAEFAGVSTKLLFSSLVLMGERKKHVLFNHKKVAIDIS